MPFIGNKPSAVPLTSADIADSIITSAKIVDATIANADIANSTINLTTKVTGTLPVANGGTGLAAIGTSLQVLRTNTGATALEYATVSSDFVLLATTDASSSASISFDGYFSSTYKNYKLIISNFVSGGGNLNIRLRKSNADITTAHYSTMNDYSDGYNYVVTSATGGADQNGRSYGDIAILQDKAQMVRGFGLTNNTEWACNFNISIFDPLSTNNNKVCFYEYMVRGIDSYNVLQAGNGGFFLSDNQNALSGISFYLVSGNITRGNFKLYGIK